MLNIKKNAEIVSRTIEEQKLNDELLKIYSPLLHKLGPNWHRHSLVALKVGALSRILHYAELYKKILDVPGVICEFGVHWGATMAELINLRSIYEPYNSSREIFGFDTFEGFLSVDQQDGGFSKAGDYASGAEYYDVLKSILKIHESGAPLSNIEKFSLIKGDACKTVGRWLDENPHAIISMAIFDMDLYKPTLEVLKTILPRLTKGSLLIFDELNCKHFPGETVALREVVGLNNLRLKRSPLQPYCSWAVWGE
jgi:hypothetical protein